MARGTTANETQVHDLFVIVVTYSITGRVSVPCCRDGVAVSGERVSARGSARSRACCSVALGGSGGVAWRGGVNQTLV